MVDGRDICANNPADFSEAGRGGTFLEYPTLQEVEHFSREVSYEERLPILSQGFRTGTSYEEFYCVEKFAKSLLRRKADAPALGIRDLPRERVVTWLRDVVGDRDLAAAVDEVFDREELMSTIVDEVRIVMVMRMEQYDEVRTNFADKYR